jgi:hypothetical protein
LPGDLRFIYWKTDYRRSHQKEYKVKVVAPGIKKTEIKNVSVEKAKADGLSEIPKFIDPNNYFSILAVDNDDNVITEADESKKKYNLWIVDHKQAITRMTKGDRTYNLDEILKENKMEIDKMINKNQNKMQNQIEKYDLTPEIQKMSEIHDQSVKEDKEERIKLADETKEGAKKVSDIEVSEIMDSEELITMKKLDEINKRMNSNYKAHDVLSLYLKNQEKLNASERLVKLAILGCQNKSLSQLCLKMIEEHKFILSYSHVVSGVDKLTTMLPEMLKKMVNKK